MSEIKGQLLGILLVLAIFGIVAGVLYEAFKSSTEEVANSINSTFENNNNNTYLVFYE